MNTEQIQEHMEVVGSDGSHIGRVDRVQGDEIELARLDSPRFGQHHMIPRNWIDWVDGRVHLLLSKEDALAEWDKQ